MKIDEVAAHLEGLKEERAELREKLAELMGKAAEATLITNRHLKYDAEGDELKAHETAVKQATVDLTKFKFEIKDLEQDVEHKDDHIREIGRELNRKSLDEIEREMLEEIDHGIGTFEKVTERILSLLERLSDDDKALDRYVGVIAKVAGKFGVAFERCEKETEAQKERHGVADAPEVPEGAQEEEAEEPVEAN